MKPIFLILVLTALTVFGCKKKPIEPEQPTPAPAPVTDIAYRKLDKTLLPTERKQLAVDVNEDGKVDAYFFMDFVATSTGVHLNFMAGTLNNNALKMQLHNDDNYLNAGDVLTHAAGDRIKAAVTEAQEWSIDYGQLAVRTISQGGATSWTGNWATGKEMMLAIKLDDGKKINYGWLRLKIDKDTEGITLVDCAWNKIVGEELIAGKI